MSGERTEWRIGELADATGLTVRTLHHYDQIGLLRPSERTVNGHRRYTGADADRLYRIVALRGLGLRLEQIRDCLAGGMDPRVIVAEQLQQLNDQLAAGERLRARLADTLAALNRHERPAAGELLDLIQRTTEVDKLITHYLDDEQLAAMARRHVELGPRAADLARQLPALYRRALAELDAGTDPTDPVVRGIAERIDRIGTALSGGRADAGAGVRRMWAERGEEIHPGAGIPWAGLTAYLDAARAGDPARANDAARAGDAVPARDAVRAGDGTQVDDVERAGHAAQAGVAAEAGDVARAGDVKRARDSVRAGGAEAAGVAAQAVRPAQAADALLAADAARAGDALPAGGGTREAGAAQANDAARAGRAARANDAARAGRAARTGRTDG